MANLAGELSSITDPFNATINYSYDSSARLSSVTGTSFGDVTTYASNPQYRAWGALKSLTYGNSKTLSMGYDNRMLPTSYEVPGVLKKSYQRNNDGSVQFTQDQLTANSKFDRSYSYDHVGRVTTALTGQEARGGAATNDRPYNESLTYDAFDNLTTLARLHWDRDDGNGPNTFSNNRMTAFTYDADGRVTLGSTGYFTYDAAGQVRSFGDNDPYHTDQEFDGYGERLKTTAYRWDDVTDQLVTEKITYYVNSTVLGGAVVTELSEQGAKERTSVFAGGIQLASQSITSGTQSVQWQHYDPSDASYRATDASGQGVDAREMDPLGANAGLFKPPTWNVPDKKGLPVPFPEIADMLTNTGGGCAFRGMPTSCHSASVEFWGSRIADLPGFGTNWGSLSAVAEWQHEQRVTYAFGRGKGFLVPRREGVPREAGPSFAFSPQNTFTIPTGNLRGNLEALLKTGDCRKFTNRVLAGLAKKYSNPDNRQHIKTVLEGFNMVSAQGGFLLESKSIHTVRGDLFNNARNYNAGPGTVLIVPSGQYQTPTAAQTTLLQALYAWAALHETLHLGKRGGYTDEQVATVMAEVDGMEPPTRLHDGTLLSSLASNDWRRVTVFSSSLDSALQRHCAYPTTTVLPPG